MSAPTPDEIDHTPLDFGKYKGRTPDQVAEIDCAWLIWAYENVLNRPVFMSELLYKECLKTPNKQPPKSVTIGTNHGAVSTTKRFQQPPSRLPQRGSLAESRSHFDDPRDNLDDEIPF